MFKDACAVSKIHHARNIRESKQWHCRSIIVQVPSWADSMACLFQLQNFPMNHEASCHSNPGVSRWPSHSLCSCCGSHGCGKHSWVQIWIITGSSHCLYCQFVVGMERPNPKIQSGEEEYILLSSRLGPYLEVGFNFLHVLVLKWCHFSFIFN